MKNLISECIETLKSLRCNIHSDCDPSVSVALDKAIAKFEGFRDKANLDDAEVWQARQEALIIISSILSCCASVADLMRRF